MNLFIRKKAYNLLDRYDVLDDTGGLPIRQTAYSYGSRAAL